MRIPEVLALVALSSIPAAAFADGASHAVSVVKPVIIDDSNSGWTWSGMDEIDDISFTGGTAHAGPIGSSGVYTFHGTGVKVNTTLAPDVLASGRRHKMGKLKVTIDGVEKTVANLASPEAQFDMCICNISGLEDKNHVLQVEPKDGWAMIDGITVLAQGVNDAAPGKDAFDPKKSHVSFFDPLDNANLIWVKSPHWELAGDFPGVFQGDSGRIRRSTEDKEFLAYQVKDISGFVVRVYTKANPATISSLVQIHVSTDSGKTTQAIPFSIAGSFPGGGDGGYTGCDLVPTGSLPDGANMLYITFSPGAGNWWDPQLAQVTIMSRN